MEEQQELPNSWARTSIGQIFKVLVGATPSRSNQDYWTGGIPWISSGEVAFCRIKTAREFISEQGLANSSTSIHPRGTVLIGMIGEGKTRGQVAILDIEACNNQNSAAIRVSETEVSPEFVYYYLLGSYHKTRRTSSGNNQPALNKERVRQMEMPLAPLPEQRRIVAKLEELFSKLDAGVATVRRTQALLKRYRQSVLHAAVTGELTRAWREAHPAPTETGAALLARIRAERRAQWEAAQVAKRGGQLPLGEGWKSKYVEPEAVDASELPELPSGWAWTTVEQLGVIGEQTVMTGPFGTSLGTSDFVTSGVPVLTIGCLTEGGIKLNKAVHITEEKAAGLERYRLKKGDLLFSRMASVGRAGFVTSELDGILFNYHIMRLRLDAETITPFFFLYYVRGAREVVSYLLRVNHGATRDGINTEQLLNLPVCLPPIAEQIEIIAEVERRLTVLDALSKTLTDELKRAERLRQSILHRAFTGRLVPQDATDEPATVLLARLRNESTAPPKARKAREPKASPASKQLPMPL